MTIKWAYGLTTVPERRTTLLPATLASLDKAGFPKPRLFVDGNIHDEATQYVASFGCEVTTRFPQMLPWGNWILGLLELYVRNPEADRYAIFQDDIIAYPHLREYLDSCKYKDDTYWNLYTVPDNQKLVPLGEDNEPKTGWYESNQGGKGALGLVFSRPIVWELFSSPHIARKPCGAAVGWRNIDGGVVEALCRQGERRHKELVHHPSLLQHMGEKTTITHKSWKNYEGTRKALNWMGDDFDARRLLPKAT